jgi:PAS domain S-box-containing protein
MEEINKENTFSPGTGLFKGLLESAPDAIVIADNSGKIVLINAQTEKLFEYNRNELIGQEIEILIPQRFHDKHVNYRNNFFHSPKTRPMGHPGINLQGKKKSGKEFPVEVSLSPFENEGKLLISAAIRDVTERRQVEELFKGLLESAPDAIVITDNTGDIVIVNAQAENLFGYGREEMLGKKIELLIPEKYRQRHVGYRDGFFHNPNTRPMGHPGINLHGKRKNGEEFPVEVSLSPFKSGEELLISASIRDISLRIQEQQELKNIKEFALLAEIIPQFIWITKEDGKADYFNKLWFDYSGLSEKKSMEGGWTQIIHPDYVEQTIKNWQEALHLGSIFEAESLLKRKDGVYRWFLIRALPVKNNENKVIKWIGSSTDIDDQKMQTKELEQKNIILTKTNNDLDNFIYAASHDLKSPIANIEGLLNALTKTLSTQSESNPMLQKLTDMMHHSIGRFKTTIQDLTDISKAQRNIEEDVETIDIEEEVENVLDSINDEIIKTGAKINIDAKACPTIRFSKRNFKSIIQNLITNAIKYRSPERSPVVQVKCWKENDFNILEVRDNGLGIKEEYKHKVFGMFKRVHHHVEGTGIGLYIVKRIVENSDGKIELESKDGEGSVFRIILR